MHDIGKTIRRANHPQIGTNLLRHFSESTSNRLLQSLQYPGEKDDHPANEVNLRRFGFQMRGLTLDAAVRDAIVNLLCIQENKEHVALTWIADEVPLWSMG